MHNHTNPQSEKREYIRSLMAKVLEENGVDINDSDSLNAMDSLQYISSLVSLEEKVEIELPDEILVHNIFTDLDKAIDLLCLLVP